MLIHVFKQVYTNESTLIIKITIITKICYFYNDYSLFDSTPPETEWSYNGNSV